MLTRLVMLASVLTLVPGGGAQNFADALAVPADPALSGEECPAGSIAGQDPGACQSNWYFYSDLEFCSGAQCARVRCDNFPAPGQVITRPIGSVTWQGVYINDASEPCSKAEHRFRIRFYEDEAGKPKNAAASYYTEFLMARARDTGHVVPFGGGEAVLWEFTAELSTPVQLANGWLTIAGTGTPGCYHLWRGCAAGEGDNKYYQWFETGGVIPGAPVQDPDKCDMAWCLGEYVLGACCDAWTGECRDGVSQVACLLAGGRFSATPCAQQQPPCDQLVGACCGWGGCELLTRAACDDRDHSHGDCNCDRELSFHDINFFVAALAGATPCRFKNCDINADGKIDFNDINPFIALLSGGHGPLHWAQWFGPDTPCAWCCAGCPGSATHEYEAECHDGYVDVTNAGCGSNPPTFTPIQCGLPVCGLSGAFEAGTPPQLVVDEDWYRVTAADAGTLLTFRIMPEFTGLLRLYRAGSCDPNSPTAYDLLAESQITLRCEVKTFEHCAAPGEYWLLVRPGADTPCGAAYTLSLDCQPCEPCVVPCPAGALQEKEPCGGDTNGGCNLDPNDPNSWEPIEPNQTYCGTMWAFHGKRDSDMFRFTLTKHSNVEVLWEAEFPAFVGIVKGNPTGQPECTDPVWGASVPPCQPTNIIFFPLPPGEYWFVPIIEATSGYPCGTKNRDVFTIVAKPGTVEFIDCTGGGFGTPEGEPECTPPNWVDTFNGGCDSAPPKFLPLNCDEGWCAASGAWLDPNDPNISRQDTDWWEISLTGPTSLTIQALSEFPLQVQLIEPGPGNACNGSVVLEIHTIACCTQPPDIETRCLSAGTYWLRFSPNVPADVPCDLNYAFFVDCKACLPCVVTCPAGAFMEEEACGEDKNGGCNASPNVFEAYTCGTTVCGWTYAHNNRRDTDWFRWTQTQAQNITVQADTEVPLAVLVITGTQPGHPTCTDLAGYQVTDIRRCEPGAPAPLQDPLPAGEYWMVVLPADANGYPIFNNYPCAGGANRYWVKVTCQ